MNTLNIENTCFFTGHRIIPNDSRPALRNRIKNACIDLIKNNNVTDFITGGALGFDTIAALVVLELKKEYPNIKLYLYFPCTNQSVKWTAYDKKMWESIKLMADDYKYISDMPYVAGCMQLRNKAMVDDAQYCVAYCTRNFGGTFSTIKYAKEKDRTITIISNI